MGRAGASLTIKRMTVLSRFRFVLAPVVAALALSACGGSGDHAANSRAERMKPATSVTTLQVSMRQAPGAPVGIGPDGTLKIDDVELPQPADKRAELQHYFGLLQMRRQAVLDQFQANGGATITIAPDAQLKPLQAQLLADFPELRPYKDSMQTIRLEAR